MHSPHARRLARSMVLLGLAVLAEVFAGTTLPAAADTVTQVFSTDFEAGLPPEFSAPGTQIDGVQGYAGLGTPGHTFGGLFLHYTAVPLSDTRLTVRNLPAHDHLDLDFLLAVIDSWDGTELFEVSVDGTKLFSHWFQLATGDSSDYIAPPGGLLSRGVNLGFTDGGYYNRDRAYEMALEPVFHAIPHTADSVVVVWSLSAISGPAAAQWQGGSDESWAIDGVRVAVRAASTGVGSGPRTGGLALEGMRPNPARAHACRVAMTLASDAPADLEMFDLAGRRVSSQHLTGLGAGARTIGITPERALSAGVYVVRLTQAGEIRTARAVIVE